MNIDYIILETSDTFSTLFDKVVEVHKKLFPDAILQSQCDKYDEEFEEFENAKDGEEICNEFADMFIVAAGISRFNKHLGAHLGQLMVKSLGDDNKMRMDLAEAVVAKMNKNIDRKWDNVDGFYKHTTLN